MDLEKLRAELAGWLQFYELPAELADQVRATLARGEGSEAALAARLRAQHAVYRVAHPLPSEALPRALSCDERFLVTGGGGARVWNVRTGELEAKLAHDGMSLWCADFSPDGSLLAGGTFTIDDHGEHEHEEGLTVIWDARTWKLMKNLPEGRGEVTRVKFSPDGSTLAVMQYQQNIALYDTATWVQRSGPPRRAGHASMAFSLDSNLLVTGGDHVELWDVRTGKRVRVLEARGSAPQVSFSPGGLLLAAGMEEIVNAQFVWGGVHVWDTRSWALAYTLESSTPLGGKPSFAADGQTLFRYLWGAGKVEVWDLSRGQLIEEAAKHDVGPLTGFQRSGEWSAGLDSAEQPRIWHRGFLRRAGPG